MIEPIGIREFPDSRGPKFGARQIVFRTENGLGLSAITVGSGERWDGKTTIIRTDEGIVRLNYNPRDFKSAEAAAKGLYEALKPAVTSITTTPKGGTMKTVFIFSYRENSIPDMPILDCRGMRNPYNDTSMTDEEKRESIQDNPAFLPLVYGGIAMLSQCEAIGVGCTHGIHRSYIVGHTIAKHIIGAKVEEWSKTREFA